MVMLPRYVRTSGMEGASDFQHLAPSPVRDHTSTFVSIEATKHAEEDVITRRLGKAMV